MKKLLAIFLLGAMLFFSMGYYVVYKYNLRSIKQQMRIAIRQGDYKVREICHFTFNAPNLASIKEIQVKDKGKEFLYKGRMYDIISISSLDGQLYISCLADDDEAKVIANFTTFIDKNSDATAHKTIKLVKYNLPVFYVEDLPGVIYKTETFNPVYCSYIPAFIPAFYLNKPSPPPWQS